MNFLLTNDDGIDAEGLRALERAFAPLGKLYVIAPDQHLSGCSHTVTTDRPLDLVEHNKNQYSLTGTPADCVRVAIKHLQLPIDWVISGINHGGNLGVDVFMSGTVAAVREGVMHGIPGIAISHFRNGAVPFHWENAEKAVNRLGSELINKPIDRQSFWNINLPDSEHLKADTTYELAPLEPEPLPVSYEQRDGRLHYVWGNYVNRPRQPETDVGVCFGGKISLSLVNLQTKNASIP
ncbi:5'-nucleotidase SurE [Polystyrenella longa]|uniref:5'-nucleotidase n=1 Tax=Polystyrenella longa TaxID=2528007 RepID=A0A518CQV1_9PLAN|nr:5'/3'-nucleotidase SurE [Polystyrenella longa]QDU81607.1 5'-nucleotidase SurE [Polystyrenella longa]